MGSFFPGDSSLCQGDREANRTKVGSEAAVWVENTNTDTEVQILTRQPFQLGEEPKTKPDNKIAKKNDVGKNHELCQRSSLQFRKVGMIY